MNLQLITLAGIKIDEPVYEVVLPTKAGEIAVFPGHEPLVSIAVPGVISVRYEKQHSDDRMEHFAISGGAIDISADRIRVLVDEAEHGDDITETESRAALKRAMAARDNATDKVELEKAQQLVNRHAVKIKVADLHRRKRR